MQKNRKAYERPILVKEKKMAFPIQIILASGRRVICRQCSSCHACTR